MKEVAYPVGYSVMPIYKENKVSSKGTVVKERNLVAYMPSKCYVVNSNDSEKCEVVFPYETGKTVAESYFMSNYPKYNKEGKCTNSHKTTFLASDYETAKEEAARLNAERRSHNYEPDPICYCVKSDLQYDLLMENY